MSKPLYTGDGIEAYEPMGVGGGVSAPDVTAWLKPPSSYLRRTEAVKVAALQDEVKRLEAEIARLATLRADHENKAPPLPAVTTVADVWANVLRASNRSTR